MKCIYCGDHYDIPHGLTLVMTDGTINHLCSSKCRKNMQMKRRKVNWIKKKKETSSEIEEMKKELSEEEKPNKK